MFAIFPAIDIREGRAVRLRQGEAWREMRYAEDPVEIAKRFAAAGARTLHVVDLDGAFAGEPKHLPVVSSIHRETGLPVRLGGGLRRTEDVEAAFDAGADVAIVGTTAIERPELLKEWIGRFGSRIAVSLDIRAGSVCTRGWAASAPGSLEEAASGLAAAGVSDLVVTDVAHDGELSGPDLALFRRAAAAFGRSVIAAGGIATAEHLSLLETEPAVRGAVVGRAFYEGTIDLEVLARRSA